MTSYTKSTNFATKDTLTSGDPLKIVKGTEINTEFDNIQTAVNSKADTASPTFTGTVTIPTASVSSTTDSSSISTGSIVTAGGIGIAKSAYVGTTLNVAGNTILGDASTDTLNVGNGGLVKDASGNVGIGTASPASGNGGGLSLGTTSAGKSIHLYSSTYASNGLANFYGTDGAAKLQMGASGSTSAFVYGNSGVLQLGGNGSETMRIDSSGNLLVGTTTTTGRIGSKAATTDNTGYGIYVEDSASALMFYARNDGVISTGAKSASPYNNTTASAANMFVNNSGVLQRSTSSLKYKTNVQDATHGLNELLTLRPVTYEGKTDGDKVFGGLIAEEVHEAGLTEFVQYAEDGSPDALAYGNMVSLCIKAIQEQQALIQTLTDRITALEGVK